jgi:hypothetical protein
MMRITRQEAREKAKRWATPIDLITGEDLPEDFDKLEEELSESVGVILSESGTYHPTIEALIQDLEYSLYVEEMPRVKMEHLVFDTHEEAVKEGYWPYKMSCGEALNVAYEHVDLHNDYLEEARQEVSAGLFAGMMPDEHRDVKLDDFNE